MVLIFINIIQSNCKKLELCSNAADETLCRISDKYQQDYPPEPLPVIIQPTVIIHDGTDVDEDRQTVTLICSIQLEWFNSNLSVKNPKTDGWYVITDDDLELVWYPKISFGNILKVEKIVTLGTKRNSYFWINAFENKLEYEEDLKLTFACDMDFKQFPIDVQSCGFTLGDLEWTTYSILFNQTKVWRNSYLIHNNKTSLYINDTTTPFNFKIDLKEPFRKDFLGENFDYTGFNITLTRKRLGTLMNTFYIPTALFAVVSMISFMIRPDIVPGRMGMTIVLLLISSNVYINIEAPNRRGFAYTEVWIVGSQLPIIFALFEYGIILMVSKHQTKSNIHFRTFDIISLCTSALFYLCFNIYYWTRIIV